ncbi:MAG: dihydrodipicolinate synthase family protein [Chloroflexota bacterium]|jgi:dihydrodipicolinate synthase/N-acetylneuraminate lyase
MGYDPETGWTASFRGVVAAPLTPLGTRGELRPDLVPAMVEFLLDRGVKGFMVGGTTAEFITLDLAERRELLESFVRAVDGRVPVIAHVGHVDRRQGSLLAGHAQDVGADATTAIAPYYYRVSELACGDYFRALASATPDLPFFVYNYPDAAGNAVSLGLFESLLDIPNLAGAKHSVATWDELEPHLSLPPHLCVMAGNDMLAPMFLRSGGRAIVSGNAAAFPEVVGGVLDAVLEGRDDEADRSMAQLETVVELGRSGAPDRLRELLTLRGVEVGRSRLATFVADEIPEAHSALTRDLLEQLDG